jgi:hypothetical protein
MIRSFRPVSHRSFVLVLVFASVTGPLLVGAGVARGAPTANAALHCVARVNNAHPTDYSTVLVTVKTSGHAHVVTTAHYRTTDTVKSGIASSSGTALIAYRISRATSGYPVMISVSVRLGASHGACKTSFTPT